MKPSKLPHPLSIQECSALLRACTRPDLYALVDWCWATGCRISEALALRWGDIDWENRQAIVRGKGNKERVVLFHNEAAKSLRVWQRAGQGSQASQTPSWSPTGAIWERSRQAYDQALRAAARRAKIGGVHFHALRHSFATQMLDGGADLITAMTLLGHARCDTTRIYWNFTEPRLATLSKSIATTLPRARHFLMSHPDTLVDLRADRLDP